MADRRQAGRSQALSLTWDQVRARRLARSFLTERSSDLFDVARKVGGIHAQVQASAELQLAARVDGLTQQDVRDALWRDRTLVKAWTLRGTLHLHPADEVALWLTARQGRRLRAEGASGVARPEGRGASARRRGRACGDRGGCLGRVRRTCARAGRAGDRGRAPRGEEARGTAAFGLRLLHRPARARGRRRETGSRSRARISGSRAWRAVDAADAQREVLRRYLWAYGPARPADFREWFGDVPFDVLDVEEVEVEGHPTYVLAGDTEFPDPQQSVRLLPEYDVYVMGFREREQLVPERVREQVAAHGRGRYEGPAGVRLPARRRHCGWPLAAEEAREAHRDRRRSDAPVQARGPRARGQPLRGVPRRRTGAQGRMTTGVPSGTTRIR